MVELTTTNITASTIAEIFYIPDAEGNIDVYIPITASSISEESEIILTGEDVDDWCHNVSLMYAVYQPQGNVWFLHLTLDRYVYDVSHPELKDRFVDIEMRILTLVSDEPIIIEHRVIQNGCEGDESDKCVFDICVLVSRNLVKINQDCSLTNEIINEYDETKTHVLIQPCE